MNSSPLLVVRNLRTHYRAPAAGGHFRKSVVKAVDNVSFELHQGEVLSLVGESGCGKTTVGRSITRLTNATDGDVLFDGKNILTMSQRQFRPLRRHIQMIFQDPFASLNPRLTVEQTLSEPLYIHKMVSNRLQAQARISEILDQVGLDADAMKRHPHEFSGGQRQRIGIARVMILQPRLVIADEAVSALDVSIQAQVLNLLKKLQQQYKMSMLFISHDLSVVRHLSDRVAVMLEGRIVEIGSKRDIFESPSHDYTRTLLASIPRIPAISGGPA